MFFVDMYVLYILFIAKNMRMPKNTFYLWACIWPNFAGPNYRDITVVRGLNVQYELRSWFVSECHCVAFGYKARCDSDIPIWNPRSHERSHTRTLRA